MIKDMLLDFVLFNLIEAFIFSYYIKCLNNTVKFKWYDISIIAIVLTFAYAFGNQIVVHLCFVLSFFVMIRIKNTSYNSNISIFIDCCIAFIVPLVIEATCWWIGIEVFKIDMICINNIFLTFIFLLPIKILDIIFAKGCVADMKVYFGEIIRK